MIHGPYVWSMDRDSLFSSSQKESNMIELRDKYGNVLYHGSDLHEILNEPNRDLERAVLKSIMYGNGNWSGHNLRHADIRFSHFYWTTFEKCEMVTTNLSRSDFNHVMFSNVDLQQADFRGCFISNTSFMNCDLRQCIFANAHLEGVMFRNCLLPWNSHEVLGHLLLNHADGDIEKEKAAHFVSGSHSRCWMDFLKTDDPLLTWAIEVLSKYIHPKDKFGVPSMLRKLANTDRASWDDILGVYS